MATDQFWGQIGYTTFIRHSGVSKRIAILIFRMLNGNDSIVSEVTIYSL